jgi:DNA-binding response OmpR family regulator
MKEPRIKILVVDDDESVCQVLRAGLEMHRLTVRCESRSTEALKACLEFHPDLVLLDVDMPLKDGGEVAAELGRHPALARTPVIFLSSLIRKQEATKRSESGEIFLSKPIPISELVARIRAVLQPQTPP